MSRNKKKQRNHEESNRDEPKKSQKRQKLNESTNSSLIEKSQNQDKSPPSETWSKSKKKRMRAIKAKLLKRQQTNQLHNNELSSKSHSQEATPQTENMDTKSKKMSKLQDAFKARLTGSRFRILNEELYTKESKESFERFSKNPELFEQYHQGFRHQVASWPVNPVDTIVKWISSNYGKQQQRDDNNNCIVADFGCGDAQIAKDLLMVNEKRKKTVFKIYSFDLVSQNELVTACDMANVPLENKSVDVVVFSLALMGTNLADFIREAHRVLKDNGRVKIAEVRSRIEYKHAANNNKGKKDNNEPTSSLSGTLEEFTAVLKKLGFDCARTDRSNKMFLFLELKKNGKPPNKTLEFSAKPCIYKRR